MAGITIPHNWTPRWYQQDVWEYLTGAPFGASGINSKASDRKHAELIWPRRAGKDDVCLHFSAREMFLNPANYWHMLPLADQVRKAIWNAVNPHSGMRRIDEAFPDEVFDKRDGDMLIRCKVNSSTWQCLGSDNFQGAVGSTPRGIIFSEWPQANPAAGAFLSPILAENHGWQIRVGTPRGKNHAYRSFESAKKNPRMFAQHYSVYDLWHVSMETLMEELAMFIDIFGEEAGIAHFEQEYECSWTAQTIGAIYGAEMRRVRSQNRIGTVPHDENYPVHCAMDIGRTDDFACWMYQVVGGEIRFIDYFAGAGKDPDEVAGLMIGRKVSINLIRGKDENSEIEVEYGPKFPWLAHRSKYRYESVGIPHDGAAKTFAAKGKSVQEQLSAVFSWKVVKKVRNLSIQDGIQSSRKVLKHCIFDEKCLDGIESLEAYHRKWDEKRLDLSAKAEHDWSSHGADAFRYCAVQWDFEKEIHEGEPPRDSLTFNEMLEMNKKRRLASD